MLLELPHLPVRSDAAFAEILYTFVLCFVVLNVATLSGQHLTNGGKAKQIYGLAIGFCIVVGGYAIGSVSGGSLNPAVSFALDTSSAMKGGSWMNCLMYTVSWVRFEIARQKHEVFVTGFVSYTSGTV